MHGGEAYLRTDFYELVRCIRAYGMVATLVTGGRGITRDVARKMKDVDISAVSVSIDGPRAHYTMNCAVSTVVLTLR